MVKKLRVSKYPRLIVEDRAPKILVVDDNEVNRMIVQKYLVRFGCDVECADEGEKALVHIHQNPVDLILMDCQMPGMDGLETTQKIRLSEDSKVAAAPIIALTAYGLADEKERCLQGGMDGYIAKPISISELYGVLASFLGEPQEPENSKSNVLDLLTPEESQRLNTEHLQNLKEAEEPGEDLIGHLVHSFELKMPSTLIQLDTAVNENNSQQVRFHAHKIRGSAGNVGANCLMNLAAKIEEFAIEDDTENAAKLIEELKKEYILALESLKTDWSKVA